MAGVGTLLKQAKKMQEKIEALQATLASQVIDVSSGGGAVQIKINGAGRFLALTLDPEFLKEEPKFVAETLLRATQEAAAKAKELNDAEMQKISAGFPLPGVF